MNKFAVIILAAGKSTRFDDNKLLSMIRGKIMIDHSLDNYMTLLPLIETIIVVIGGYRKQMEEHLQNKNVEVVYNPDFNTGGMISSIQTGINYLRRMNRDIEGIFIHPADVPFVNIDDIQNMIELMMSSEKYGIVVPNYNEQRGHPVLVNGTLIKELEYLNEDTHGLRGFLDKFNNDVGYMHTHNSGVRRDIDYKSDIADNE